MRHIKLVAPRRLKSMVCVGALIAPLWLDRGGGELILANIYIIMFFFVYNEEKHPCNWNYFPRNFYNWLNHRIPQKSLNIYTFVYFRNSTSFIFGQKKYGLWECVYRFLSLWKIDISANLNIQCLRHMDLILWKIFWKFSPTSLLKLCCSHEVSDKWSNDLFLILIL